MAITHVSADALLDAIGRFDRELRDTADWSGWEQNRAHRYAIEHDRRRYPVKQIVSIATGIPVADFSGGEAAGNANQYVAARGFAVVELRRRNPTWVRDELILALDMYLQYAGNPPRKGSAEIDELSETLNRLGRYLGIATEDRFRNVNGVYMKLMNFRRFDPVFTEAGKRGLSRGGQAEEEVWSTFSSDPERCHTVAQTIRQILAGIKEEETATELIGDEIGEAAEGRAISAMHRRYERSSALVQAKKRKVLATAGRLACEACGFDFRERYGDRGDGFIECHHVAPVHTLKPGSKTKLGDLRLLCSNCHRMVHAGRRWLTIEELVAIIYRATEVGGHTPARQAAAPSARLAPPSAARPDASSLI
jgi:5-methylcytosine-specific restriction protein A